AAVDIGFGHGVIDHLRAAGTRSSAGPRSLLTHSKHLLDIRGERIAGRATGTVPIRRGSRARDLPQALPLERDVPGGGSHDGVGEIFVTERLAESLEHLLGDSSTNLSIGESPFERPPDAFALRRQS